MTDRLKGYNVILERDVREDDAEYIENALKMVKGVGQVVPLVSGAEDAMVARRTKWKLQDKIWQAINNAFEEEG